MLDISF